MIGGLIVIVIFSVIIGLGVAAWLLGRERS